MTINGIQWNLSKKNGDDTLWLLNIRKNPAIYKWSACYKEDLRIIPLRQWWKVQGKKTTLLGWSSKDQQSG